MAEVQTQTEAGEMTQIFIEFVMMQAQNAALCLGQITDPRLGQPQVNIPLAQDVYRSTGGDPGEDSGQSFLR